MTDITAQNVPPGYELIPVTGLVVLILLGPAICLMIFLFKNLRNPGLKDIWNLYWRRGRCVRADMKTGSGRIITRYVVPDARNIFKHNKGAYTFPKQDFEIDAKYRIPVACFIENQIEYAPADLVMTKRKVDAWVIAEDGTKEKKEIELQSFLLTHAGIKPKLLPIARRNRNGDIQLSDQPPLTSVEMMEALDSKIARETIGAKLSGLMEKPILILAVVILILVVLMGVATYNHVSQVDQHIQAATDLMKGVKSP